MFSPYQVVAVDIKLIVDRIVVGISCNGVALF